MSPCKRKCIARVLLPIHPEAALHGSPVVIIPPVQVLLGTPREAFPVKPVAEIVAHAAPIARAHETLFHIPAARRHQRPLRIFRALRDHVDHAVHRVRTPNRAPRSSDYLDPVDVLHHRVLHVPVRSVEQRGVHRPAIDQHQHRPRQIRSEAADPNRPDIRVDPRHLHPGRHAQSLWNASRAGSPDVLTRDHENSRRRLECFHRRLGWSGDFDLGQFFQAQVLER